MSEANVESTNQSKPVDLLWKSRWAARLLVGLAFIVATCPLVLFGYQVWMRDALTGDLMRNQQGAWLRLSSHLIRACAAAWLMIRAWQYVSELKAARNTSQADYRPLFAAIARGINAAGWSCLILWSLGILSVIDATYGLPSLARPARRFTREFAPMERREVKIEFREAQFDPREGWVESFMTVVEPVRKPLYLRDSVIIDEGDIIEARPTVDSNGEPALSLNLSKAGAEKMLAWSTAIVDKHMAIIVDGTVIQAPIVRTPIGGSLLLTGRMSSERVQEIADSINGK